ncbi:metallophosphoesterase [Paenibacillus ginsengarvi]|uniref:Calcineurin-like phosphoesterase domain-containing protein n=1 Tax=Paenibacillus ginsengarvi TaxID=400777 RepID=A0A3B0CJA6_9BACL|nr:metallophosphoesterase [Paenibacillus ginsengarvi]RKN84369.1 hypothetical protein D7M11_12810 [Paenibacillus ginsengarvi]
MTIDRTAAAKSPVSIEDFEQLERIGVRSVQANQVSIDSERRSDYVRFGSQSLRLEYDFTGTIGTSCAYVLFHDSPERPHRTLEGYPRRIGVWLYGNTGGHWLRGLLIDADHEKKPIDFTAKGELRWEGWKYVSANVPEGLKQPIKLVHLYVVETENDNKDSGVCYMDGLVAEYEEVGEDWSGPEFSDMRPRPRQTVHNAEPIVSAIVRDSQSGVDESTLLITVDGISVSFSYDADSGRIVYTPVLPLNDGEHEVVIEASDRAGNPAVPKAHWSFVIDTSPDRTPPVVRIISPLPGTAVNTDHPRIAAAIEDDHAGVDFTQLRVWLDGQPQQVGHSGETVFFTCREKLTPLTEYQVRIVAADNAGNRCECSWSFRVGALPGQPRIADRFSMTVIGDGGYYTASSRTQATAADLLLTEQMSRIRREPSELIGYTGDIVDNDTTAGYAEAIKRMSGFGKPYLLAIGNHEVSGTGSRRHFQDHFGDPTYAYVYGNTLMIVLDSASGHLTRSDASQWLWLENELREAALPNVFIFMHVPPDQLSPSGEDYNTRHGFMDKLEAQRFYDLLGSFKQGRPETNVFVFSGDFHVYQHKLVQGVHYIISGGGGKQAHIAPEKGGYYHYLNVHVEGATVTWDVIPLLESIDWPDGGPVKARVGDRWKLNAAGTFLTSTNTPITLPIGYPFKAEWSSEQADLAAVDQEGNVTALAVGETFITVKCGWREGRIAIKVAVI